jgi:hypothetical protein
VRFRVAIANIRFAFLFTTRAARLLSGKTFEQIKNGMPKRARYCNTSIGKRALDEARNGEGTLDLQSLNGKGGVIETHASAARCEGGGDIRLLAERAP